MTVWLSSVSGVLIAVLAALLAYWNAQRLSERQSRLDRVNKQLEELYGPVLALVAASARSWEMFRRNYRPEGSFFGDGRLTKDERDAWIAWMEIVFMPSNRRIYELIVSNTHLLDGDDMPPALLDFLAHVSGYEVAIAAWEAGDYSKMTSLINHPGAAFDDYFKASFAQLKQRQQELLGTKAVERR